MNHDKESKLHSKDTQKDPFGWLLRLAGSRPAVPENVSARIKDTVHLHWKQTVRRRNVKRRLFAAGIGLAASFLIYLIALQVLTPVIPAATAVGFVENLSGNVLVFGDQNVPGHLLTKGDIILTGSALQTGEAGRLLFHLVDGATMRLDVKTRLRLKSESSFLLEEGAVYIDSGRTTGGMAVVTSMGIVSDIGTQFEVRMRNDTLRIRVREGLVSFEQNGFSRPAAEGTELAVDRKGSATIKDVARYGPQWSWVSELAPAFHLEGHTLMEYLNWVTRENGWGLRFAEPQIEKTAPRTILHGSIRGLMPDLTPGAVLPICGLSYDLKDGVLTIKPGNKN